MEPEKFNHNAAWEAGKLTSAIIGAVGYAALIASSKLTGCVLSLSIFGACWYGIYRMMR